MPKHPLKRRRRLRQLHRLQRRLWQLLHRHRLRKRLLKCWTANQLTVHSVRVPYIDVFMIIEFYQELTFIKPAYIITSIVRSELKTRWWAFAFKRTNSICTLKSLSPTGTYWSEQGTFIFKRFAIFLHKAHQIKWWILDGGSIDDWQKSIGNNLYLKPPSIFTFKGIIWFLNVSRFAMTSVWTRAIKTYSKIATFFTNWVTFIYIDTRTFGIFDSS